ncbi:3-oxoadipate enol-lactonase [Brucella gallinifaecis]|uniref:3-oxoadipate enol-lactonase n=1 Tax=Brucella gallinifaecis TaxID=215590 RepID=A0A502BM55_9HYPH|nr:3-oxoadipate enol-lactonase [Brucella gallinifaecis]TPF74396.1 3-oxoadipate enol-lactonase [Brucella gallinifaecis]
MPFIERDGVAIHYQLSGQGKETVVFLNSLGADISMWAPQAEALKQTHRLIRLDWPGHGGSNSGNRIANINTLVADVAAVMDVAGVAQAHIAGLSLGGLVAQAMALDKPERVQSLFLCATAAAFAPPELWETRASIVMTEGMEPMVAASQQRWFTPAYSRDHREELTVLFTTLRAIDPAGYAFCCRVLRDTNLKSRLSNIRVPVLLVAGMDDPATPPASLEEIAGLVPQAQLVVLGNAAHILNVEQADETTRLLQAFLHDSKMVAATG